MQVYLVVVTKNPTKKAQHDEGAVPVVVAGPVAVIAKDEAGAAMKAHRIVPEEHASNPDLLDVAVLPFRSVAARVGA